MKRFYFLFGLFSISFFSALWSGTTEYAGLHEADMYHQHLVDQIVLKKFRVLERDKVKIGLTMGSAFNGELPLDPHTPQVRISIKKTAREDVERDLVYFSTNFLQIYNNIRQIRPYLSIFPVPSDKYDVDINYGASFRHRYPEPYYSGVLYDISSKTIRFWHYVENPTDGNILHNRVFLTKPITDYPELLANVDLKLPRTESNDCVPIIIDSKVTSTDETDRALLSIAKRLCKKYSLHISAARACGGGIGQSSCRTISAGFWSQQRELELEGARKFALQFLEEYLTEIRDRKIIEKTVIKTEPVLKDLTENLNWFCFRMTFWDKWLNRVDKPYIAQIQCQDGKIIYYRADDGQRLYQAFEEPIPEKFFPKPSQRT